MVLTGFVCAWHPDSTVGRIRSCPDNFEYVFLLADNPGLAGALSRITNDWETSAMCPGDSGLIFCTFTPGPADRAYHAMPRVVAAALAVRAGAARPGRVSAGPDSAGLTLHAAAAEAAKPALAGSARPELPVPTVWGTAQVVPVSSGHTPTVSSVGAGKQCSVLFTGFTIHLEATDPGREVIGVRFRLPYAGKPSKVQVKNLLRGYVHKGAKAKVELILQMGSAGKKIALSAGKATDDNFTQEVASQFVASTRALYDVRISVRATRPAKSFDPLIVTIDSLDVEAS